MKNTVLILILSVGVLFGCKGQSANIANDKYELLSPGQFYDTMIHIDGEIVLDVRTPEEYSEGHIKGAVNINYEDDDFATQVSKLNKSRTVMVYCGSGNRSDKASTALLETGFPKVYDLDGGVEAWIDQKYPY